MMKKLTPNLTVDNVNKQKYRRYSLTFAGGGQ